MKGDQQKLIKLLANSSTRFVIPLYQRNYDWKAENCEQLFNDLIKLHKSNRSSHFFGSIVSENTATDEVYVIDGQQRITTISILLIALYNCAKDKQIEVEDDKTIQKIWKRYLTDEFIENERKVKLKPIKNDMTAFDNLLFKSPSDYISDSNVTRNYNFFYKKIKESGLRVEDFVTSIEKLVVIDIKIERDDDAQLIFESLNSTGKDLEEADKIRNYLLMSLDQKTQEDYYNKYWNKIEEYTGYSPTMFIRDYLTISLKKISKIDDLYKIFKRYVESNNMDRGDLLKDMVVYAEIYNMIQKEISPDVNLKSKLKQINTLGSYIVMPFFLAYFKFAKENGFAIEEQCKIIDLVQNYWARRIICNLPTNALNKVFSTLHFDTIKLIEKFKLTIADYYETLKFVLLKKQGTSIFPNDVTVKEEFKKRQIYRMPVEYRYFMFERMENGIQKGMYAHDIPLAMKDGQISIEHIMPQTLTTHWRRELGERADEIHEQYLHTFANLTLTGYNSNYGNRPFSEKKVGYIDKDGKQIFGFNQSQYFLSDFVKKCNQWTEKELIERQDILFNRFLQIWPMIETTVSNKNVLDVVSLDDDDLDVLTGRLLSSYTYKGDNHKVSNWKNMLVEICKILHSEHEVLMEQLCHKNYNLYDYQKTVYDYSKFAEGCYVYSANSTMSKMGIIKYMFDALSIDYADLEFELEPVDD